LATPIPDNSARLRVDEIVDATAGTAVGIDAATELVGVATDSRRARAGGLFVALRGAVHDGHAFVDTVRALGAVPLVARGAGITTPRIEVDDPLVALGRLARRHVERLEAASSAHRPLLAIGGAAGKTTTKSLAAAAVGALFGDTLVTAGNLNNRIGVPMTLLTLEPRHRAVVLECATSERGEIAALAAIARPDVSLVINVGIEHSEGLGSLEEIADEEAELLRAADAAAMTLADEPLLTSRFGGTTPRPNLTFGRGAGADARLVARRVEPAGSAELTIELGERLCAGCRPRRVTARTGLLGPAAALNLVAALGAALSLLSRPPSEAELSAALAALAGVEPVPGRMCPRDFGDVLALDDTYNCNPQSLAAALATAEEIASRRGGRLLIALGDMLELGELSASAHDEMLRAVDALRPAQLFLVGDEWSAAATRREPAAPHLLFAESGGAASVVSAALRPGDTLLAKGSRGVRMERVVEAAGTKESPTV